MVRLTIVIPAMATTEALEASLVSILENRPEGCEILVPNGGDYKDPYDLADEVRFLEVAPKAGPIAAIQAAVGQASASLIHVMLPGTLVEPDWCEEAIDRLWRDLRVASVSPQIQVASRHAPIYGVTLTAGGARQLLETPRAASKAVRCWGPTLSAGFYRRSALQAVGGWDTQLLHAADADLAVRMAEHGFACAAVDTQLVAMRSTCEQSPYHIAHDTEVCFWRHRNSRAVGMSLAAHGWACASRWARLLTRPWTVPSDVLGLLQGWAISPRSKTPLAQDADDEAQRAILPYLAPQSSDEASNQQRRSA